MGLSRLPYLFRKSLTPRQRIILIHRLEGKSLEEIGKIYDVTRERIRQIEAKAWKQLQEAQDE